MPCPSGHARRCPPQSWYSGGRSTVRPSAVAVPHGVQGIGTDQTLRHLLQRRPGKCRNPTGGTGAAKDRQISVKLLQVAALLARLHRLSLQSGRELWFDHPCSKLLRDRIARKASPARNLPDRQLVPQCHGANDVQRSDADRSLVLCCAQQSEKRHMAQFSVRITRAIGSLAGRNQQMRSTPKRPSKRRRGFRFFQCLGRSSRGGPVRPRPSRPRRRRSGCRRAATIRPAGPGAGCR